MTLVVALMSLRAPVPTDQVRAIWRPAGPNAGGAGMTFSSAPGRQSLSTDAFVTGDSFGAKGSSNFNRICTVPRSINKYSSILRTFLDV